MATKKILGLDIGTTSIGWAIVEATDEKKVNERTCKTSDTDINNDRIGIHKDAVGVRIIPADEMQRRFNEGLKLNQGDNRTPTANRRVKRGSRRLKSRYKLRRDKLCSVLEKLGMLPDASYQKVTNNNGKEIWKPVENQNSKWYTKQREYVTDEKGKMKKKREEGDIGEQLYKLRSDAILKENNTELKDWGRILLHLNQWRGYSSDRFIKDDKTSKDYFTVEITEFDKNNFEPIFDKKDKEKTKPIYNKYSIKLKCEDGIDIKENEEKKLVYELAGTVYYQKPDIKQGDFIVIKNMDKGGKNDKKITTDKGNFTITNPADDDWQYNRQVLNKGLKEWCENGGSVGSYFYNRVYDKKYREQCLDEKIERIRKNVVNREWYEDEFDKIWAVQYPKHKEEIEKYSLDEILNATFKDDKVKNEVKAKKTYEEKLKYLIKEKIIYYQRPWQQSKNKAGCRFEKVRVFKKYFDKETQTYKLKTEPEYEGRKVIPRSHHLHQQFKIWQQINNVRLFYNEPNNDIKIDIFSNPELFKEYTGKSIQDVIGKTIPEIKKLLYKTLENEKSVSWKKFVVDILGLNVADEIEKTEKPAKGKKKRQYRKEGVDTETGEVLKTFYTVNFRKLKRDKSDFEDIRLKGNTTKRALKGALFVWFKGKGYLETQIKDEKETVISDTTDKWFNAIAKSGSDNHNPEDKNRKGKEIKSYNYKTKNYVITNLQLLWEIIYDITNRDEPSVIKSIKNNFKKGEDECIFCDDTLKALAKIKFDDGGMGNLSAKAIRNLLPLMNNGANMSDKAKEKVQSLIALNISTSEKDKPEDEKLECIKDFVSDKNSRIKLSRLTTPDQFKYLNYWEAAAVVYGSHSGKKIQRVGKLERIPKGKMNNPVVEKIVNETLMLVNDVVARYGKLDEIRIELARELKNSADERKQINEAIRHGEERNELAKRMLRELFKKPSPSMNDITKFKVYEDTAKRMNNEKYVELKNRKDYTLTDEDKLFLYENAYKEFELKEPCKADISRYNLWMDQKYQCPYTGETIKISDVFTAKYEVEHIIPKQRYYDNSYSNKVITRTEINQWKDKRTAYEFILAESGKTKTVDGKELRIIEWDGKNDTDPYPKHIIRLFPKGRKQKNLLRKEIPDDPIERQLKETQYINKKLKEELSKILPEGKEAQVTTGAVTDILRDSWHLEKVMKELVRPRYEKFIIGMGQGTAGKGTTNEKINYEVTYKNKKTGQDEIIEKFPGFYKRLDHRHHALDAIIIACTKQWHIQYINTLNASWSVDDVTDEKQKAGKYEWNKEAILRKNTEGEMGAYDFIYPWKGYTKNQIQETLEKVIVSHKNTIPLISPSKNLLKKNGEIKLIGKPEDSISIRASLHKETLIGFRKFYNNEKQVPINDVIDLIFEERRIARAKLKPVLPFNELIDRIVFKENFRNALKSIFEESSLGKNDDVQIKNAVSEKIKNKRPFEWTYTYNVVATKTGTDKGGTIDKLSPEKIIDPRISRYLGYRQTFIKTLSDKIEKLKKEKADDTKITNQEELLKKAKDYPDGYPIYYNAICDVRIPSDPRKWVPVTELNQELFDKIEYHKNKKIDNKRTREVKEKISSYKGEDSWEEAFKPERVYILDPPIIGNTGIKIKKASLKNKTTLETLYPIREKEEKLPKTYVELDGNFRVYMFEKSNGDNVERKWEMLSNMDAMLLKKENRTSKTEQLYPAELTKELTEKGFHQVFSIGKNDTVFINPENPQNTSKRLFSNEKIKDLFDWEVSDDNSQEKVNEKQGIVSRNLWQVSIISKSSTDPNGSIHFVSMHTADKIKIPINEVNTAKMQDKVQNKIETMKTKYNKTENSKEKTDNKFLEEKIILGRDYLWQNCIKVYVDKLGKKVVPYWEFKSGCWDKERAKELGLLPNNDNVAVAS
ncbi:MAG: hypothetical protein HYY40_11700 [Bacteroidetes bacterium]|nr:hypothetical protein [Bacteroidota bacterium]